MKKKILKNLTHRIKLTKLLARTLARMQKLHDQNTPPLYK